MNEKILNNPAKLKWACRRGMLELDVLLGNFLEQAYSSLNSEEKEAFIRLLDCADPELFAWLLGQETPKDPRFIHIIQVIRQHVRK